MPVLDDGTPVDQTGRPRPLRRRIVLAVAIASLAGMAVIGGVAADNAQAKHKNPAYAGN